MLVLKFRYHLISRNTVPREQPNSTMYAGRFGKAKNPPPLCLASRAGLRSHSDHNPRDRVLEYLRQNNGVVQFQRIRVRLDKVHGDETVAGPKYAREPS